MRGTQLFCAVGFAVATCNWKAPLKGCCRYAGSYAEDSQTLKSARTSIFVFSNKPPESAGDGFRFTLKAGTSDGTET